MLLAQGLHFGRDLAEIFQRVADDCLRRFVETGKYRLQQHRLDVFQNGDADFEHLEPPFDRRLVIGRHMRGQRHAGQAGDIGCPLIDGRGGVDLFPALRALFRRVILWQAGVACAALYHPSRNCVISDDRAGVFKGHDDLPRWFSDRIMLNFLG